MHPEILDPKQTELLPLIQTFTDTYVLVGGTAIALQLGHRRSIDFDNMTNTGIQSDTIVKSIKNTHTIQSTLIDSSDELTILVNDVKLTFFSFPFSVDANETFESIKLPGILQLGAMKAYALGRRSKWKDYVDLYFLFEKYALDDLVKVANKIFTTSFSEKLFREQLVYFDDIDYSEIVDYMPNYQVPDEVVKRSLIEVAMS